MAQQLDRPQFDTAPIVHELQQLAQAQVSAERGRVELAERVGLLDAFVSELAATAEALRREIGQIRESAKDASRVTQALRDQLNTVPYLARPFERFESPVGEVEGYRQLPESPGGIETSAVADFQDIFRGPAERVLELQRPYLELLAGRAPVLDVGCGRGEFLTLLRDAGIEARGVDTDAAMVERVRALGLEATRADAGEYLDRLADASLGAVFCAQVIEHMTAAQLERLLSLARRKLRPAGLLIAETVNPHSIPAMKTYWVDRTHWQPVFPEVALVECSIAGFSSAYVFAPGHRSFVEARHSANSYAVVACV